MQLCHQRLRSIGPQRRTPLRAAKVSVVRAVATSPPGITELADLAVKKYVELYNDHRLEVVDELFAKNLVIHDDGMWTQGDVDSRAIFKERVKHQLQAIPDHSARILDVAATDDQVYILYSASGTNANEYLPGHPPSGKRFELLGLYKLQFGPEGLVKDKWFWRSPSTDEAEYFLLDPSRPFTKPPPFPEPPKAVSAKADEASSLLARHARLQLLGLVHNDEVLLRDCLAPDVNVWESTGVWSALACSNASELLSRYREALRTFVVVPRFVQTAATSEQRVFAHFELELRNRRTGDNNMVRGAAYLIYDDAHRVKSAYLFRGPLSREEKRQYFKPSHGAEEELPDWMGWFHP